MRQTQDEVIVNAEQVRLDAERAEVALLNRNEMIKLMSRHGILIPARRLAWWRPTERTSGAINGVRDPVTIIATDGLLGWFLTAEGEAWCGHINWFTSDVKPLFKFSAGTGKARSSIRKKSKRQMILDSL